MKTETGSTRAEAMKIVFRSTAAAAIFFSALWSVFGNPDIERVDYQGPPIPPSPSTGEYFPRPEGTLPASASSLTP